jgi:hypothetical protein
MPAISGGSLGSRNRLFYQTNVYRPELILPFGHSEVTLEVSQVIVFWESISLKVVVDIGDEDALITTALENPIGTPRLA